MDKGRPSDYCEEIANKICEGIANGQSLRTLCLDDDMPSKATVFRWLGVHKDFQDQYARARETQADVIFDEILSIADEAKNDTYVDENGNVRTDQEVIARSRLRVDARKWMAGKLRPKVYGEKVISEVSGPDGGPIESKVSLSGLTDEQLRVLATIPLHEG